MTKETFKTMLTDVYTAYNPGYIKLIDNLVEKYHGGFEFDSLENIFIKYNTKDAPHYDPEKDTDEYKAQIIKDYEDGKRPLRNFSLLMEVERKKKAKEEALANESESERKERENSEKHLEDLDKKISEGIESKNKEIEGLKKQIKNLSNPVEIKHSGFDDVEIIINSNYTESEIELPNKERLASLGVGTRVITSDKEGKVIGLIVEDVIYDCLTEFEGKQVLEITLTKG